MSTPAPAPVPHHVHLPSKRGLSRLGFLLGAAIGALTWLVSGSIPPALLVFVVVWYAVGYGVQQVVDHEAHRREWIVHVACIPVGAIVVAAILDAVWTHPGWAVVFGLIASIGLQVLVTHTVLRGVVDDQQHDLRRKLGLE